MLEAIIGAAVVAGRLGLRQLQEGAELGQQHDLVGALVGARVAPTLDESAR